MRSIVFALAFVFASGSTALPSTMSPMAAVRQYVDGFNKGDVKAMAATCAAPASILDGLPPHAWQGPTACEDWYRDVMAAGEREGATGYFVTLGEARHVDVHGDRARAGHPPTTFHRERQKRHGPPLSTRAGGGLGDGHRIRSASVCTGIKDLRTGPFSVNSCHTSIQPAVIVRCGSRWQGGHRRDAERRRSHLKSG